MDGKHGNPPAQVTSISNGEGLVAEDIDGPTVPQENHKPKRKYVKKQRTPVEEPATEPPGVEEPEAEEQTEPGARQRRGAAKAWAVDTHSVILNKTSFLLVSLFS